jgi:5-methyltetrahydrofolate--homocysteine methyltransferase
MAMLLIGEKLNVHAYKRTRRAVEKKDGAAILDIARDQINQGADVLDVHGGGLEDQRWMLETLSELKFPLTVDNMDPKVVRACLEIGEVKFINSIGEGRLDLFKEAKEYGVSVVGLLYNVTVDAMLEAAKEHDFDISKLYLDPAVQSVAADPKQGPRILKDHRELKSRYNVKTIAGIGNVSHMMPGKGNEVNAALLISLMHDGLDAAIINVERLAWFVWARQLLDDPSGKALMKFLKRYKALAKSDKK